MKQVLTKNEVEKAINDLLGRGKKPTLAAIHAALDHRGSMTTLIRLKAELEAAAQPATDSADGLKAFREVWALAAEEGRQKQMSVSEELRESIKALISENERLEGAALAAHNLAANAEKARSNLEEEMNQLKSQMDAELKKTTTALTAASSQAATAFQSLAQTHAAHAREIASLKSELTVATQKSHELELEVARSGALLQAKMMETPAPTTKKAHVQSLS